MSTLNTITIMGRLGDDVDIKDIRGAKLAEFAIATHRISKDQQVSDWHDIKAWRYTADRVATWRKGDYVWVEGELVSDKYERNGIKITKWSINMKRGQRIRPANPHAVGGGSQWQ